MVVILITVLAQNNMSRKCFITFLTTTAQTERSDSNPRLQPRCLRSSHTSLLRRKVARISSILTLETLGIGEFLEQNRATFCWFIGFSVTRVPVNVEEPAQRALNLEVRSCLFAKVLRDSWSSSPQLYWSR